MQGFVKSFAIPKNYDRVDIFYEDETCVCGFSFYLKDELLGTTGAVYEGLKVHTEHLYLGEVIIGM